ncbi:MAG: prephenate dehydrogenase/arogenate dehydrogenase family protein [Gammaproteobacteria bacterium]|nr:MAG: prephenate dehydrogenase/arogenate dehydrogenase family protein [Gammaproteobacteria bacterium]
MIANLTIIGVGLIGGSLARALRFAGGCERITGSGRSEANLQRAVELGVIDDYSTDITEAVAEADVIVACVPLGAMTAVFGKIKAAGKESAIITDVGSSKVSVLRSAQEAFGKIPQNFIPGHPIAGTEKSGVEASFSELYRNRKIILTPDSGSSPQALAVVEKMWQQTGAQVITMDAQHHDKVLAATSHLPHLLAYGIVDTLANMDDRQEIFEYAAGGFRDFTRIASSDPTMWRDICIHNRDAIIEMMELYTADMQNLTDLVRNGDKEALFEMFSQAKVVRDRFNDMLNGSFTAQDK